MMSTETTTDSHASDNIMEHKISLITVTSTRRTKFVVETLIFCHVLSTIPLIAVNQFFLYGKMEEVIAARFYPNQSERKLLLDEQNHHTTSTNHCERQAKNNNSRSSLQHDFVNQVQAETAHFNMVSFAVMTAPTIVSTVLLSAYSDQCGRKIAILPPLLSSAVFSLLYLVVILLDLSPWTLMVGNILKGISGNDHLMMAGCYAYISDTTTKEQRQTRMIYVSLARIMPHAMASIVVGKWVKNHGYVWPTAFSTLLGVLCVFYALLLMPETIQNNNKAIPFFTIKHLKEGMKVFLPNERRNSTSRYKLWTLVLIIILHHWGTGSWSVAGLYQLEAPFCWDAVTIGYYHTVNTAVAGFGGLCTASVLRRLTTEEWSAVIGGATYTAAYIYQAKCKNTLMMFFRPVFNIFTVLLLPTTMTLLSKQVSHDEQGFMFGVISVLEAVAGFGGIEFFVYLYAQTLHISPTFVLYIAAGLYFTVTLIYIFYTQYLTSDQDRTDHERE